MSGSGSPPSRGRGSKLRPGVKSARRAPSPPSRGRGSKLKHPEVNQLLVGVASLAGAWIETLRNRFEASKTPGRLPRGGVDRNVLLVTREGCMIVASLAGAWIETSIRWSPGRSGRSSPPSRGRGSKPPYGPHVPHGQPVASLAGAWIETISWRLSDIRALVASLAGAWIETSIEDEPDTCGRRLPRGGVDRNCMVGAIQRVQSASPPSRGRGSKRPEPDLQRGNGRSPPSRGRGSKPYIGGQGAISLWSPPSRGRGSKPGQTRPMWWLPGSPPSRGRGSKPWHQGSLHASGLSPPSRGRGSKLDDVDLSVICDVSPPSRGRGSKHDMLGDLLHIPPVASLAGAWIETILERPLKRCQKGRLPRGGVDRN